MPSTALTMPSSVSKCTLRSLTSSSGCAIGIRLLVAHARVEERVQEVDDEAHQRDRGGQDDRGALDRRQVAALDRVEGEPSDAVDVEHGLRQDGTTHEDPD